MPASSLEVESSSSSSGGEATTATGTFVNSISFRQQQALQKQQTERSVWYARVGWVVVLVVSLAALVGVAVTLAQQWGDEHVEGEVFGTVGESSTTSSSQTLTATTLKQIITTKIALHDGAGLTTSTTYQYQAVNRLAKYAASYSDYSADALRELYALACLFYATEFPSSSSWLKHNRPYCSWEGITCDSDQHVAHIHLSGIGLSGNLPEELTLLPYLSHLNLDENPKLEGPLPAFLAALPLDYLSLTETSFSGAMPDQVCRVIADNPDFTLHLDCHGELTCASDCCPACH